MARFCACASQALTKTVETFAYHYTLKYLTHLKKTRLQFRNSKQVVTGLIVNKKLNVDRAYYRKTKAMAHSLYTK
jgi:hypothetical protein